MNLSNRAGEVGGAVSFHQCGLGSIPDSTPYVGRFVGSLLCSETFSPGFGFFLSLIKTTAVGEFSLYSCHGQEGGHWKRG